MPHTNEQDIVDAKAQAENILQKRAQFVGPNVALSYATPLHMVRGEGCYLYDGAGRRYLDCVNNVAHVGHCHPEVVAATCTQMATLNTNCRYLHDNYPDYCQALVATMPKPLEVNLGGLAMGCTDARGAQNTDKCVFS